MENTTHKITISFPLPLILTAVFLTLKLCGVIGWNWFWVFSPLVFAIGLAIIGIIIGAIAYFIVNRY